MTELRRDVVHQLLAGRGIGNVDPIGQGTAACGLDLLRHADAFAALYSAITT